MSIRSLFVGETEPSRRVVKVAIVATIVASVPIVLRVDTVLHSLRWYLWGGLVVLAVGLAGYAGRKEGGLLGAWLTVFLAILWLYVVPPLVALLQGASAGGREYDTLRPSVVTLTPYDELTTGLKFGPIVALLLALTLGSTAFIFGKGMRRVVSADSRT